MRDHAERVDTGIRAAAAVQARLAGKIARQHGLDFLLHARADFLQLPALVSRAVVSDDEFEFQCLHDSSFATDGHR